MNRVVEAVGDSYKKAEVPRFEVGDTVDVHVRIKEGDRERIQVFNGTVIGRKGRGVNAAFTVRHIFQGEGVERIFPLHCPSVENVEVKRRGRSRRAKLYFLRERTGRATRLAEKRSASSLPGAGAAPGAAEAPEAPAEES